jgi:hypothetical protein
MLTPPDAELYVVNNVKHIYCLALVLLIHTLYNSYLILQYVRSYTEL